MARTKHVVVLAALALFGTACGEEEVLVDLTSLPGPPGSSLQGDNVTLNPGTALVIDARPKESDGKAVDTTVEIVSAEPFEVSRTSVRNRFVIVATASGQAKLRVV